MRRTLGTWARVLFTGALLGVTAGGCGSRLLHRRGPAEMSVPASGDAATQPTGNHHKEKGHGDKQSASDKIPFTDLLNGTAKFPDELYAVVKVN